LAVATDYAELEGTIAAQVDPAKLAKGLPPATAAGPSAWRTTPPPGSSISSWPPTASPATGCCTMTTMTGRPGHGEIDAWEALLRRLANDVYSAISEQGSI
jgi:hypothetical protein